MDFSLSPEQLALERAITAFARKQQTALPPPSTPASAVGTGDRQRGERFDHAGWAACASYGLQGLPVAEAHDGLGRDMQTCVVALRTFARECPRNGLLFALCSHLGAVAMPIQRYGTDAQRDQYLPDLASGARVAGAPLVHTSSDRALATAVRMTESDSGFILDGAIPMVCNASVAEIFLIVAGGSPAGAAQGSTHPSAVPTHEHKTAFLVPRDTPGLTIDEPAVTNGLHDAPVARLSFASLRLPRSALLGSLHQGGEVLASCLSHMFCLVLACQVGRMQQQVQRCIAQARDRQQFGRPIGSFQAISHAIADMKTRADMACMAVERLAWKLDHDEPALMDAAMAKAVVTEGYIQSSRAAIQVHGGSGIMRETDLGRDLCDALASHVYLGASEVPRDIIAQLLLGIEPLDL